MNLEGETQLPAVAVQRRVLLARFRNAGRQGAEQYRGADQFTGLTLIDSQT